MHTKIATIHLPASSKYDAKNGYISIGNDSIIVGMIQKAKNTPIRGIEPRDTANKLMKGGDVSRYTISEGTKKESLLEQNTPTTHGLGRPDYSSSCDTASSKVYCVAYSKPLSQDQPLLANFTG